jgi:hypothetical protein
MQYIFIKNGDMANPSGYAIDNQNILKYIGFEVNGNKAPNIVSAADILTRPDIAILMDYNYFRTLAIAQNLDINNNTNFFNQSQTQNRMMYNVNPTGAGMVGNVNPTVIPVETVRGAMQTGRVETPFQSGGEIITFQLSLDYSNPTAPGTDASILVGDAFDIIKTLNPSFDNSVAAAANGFVTNGTYGVKTLDVIQKLSTKGVRFHIFQGEATAASYWSNKVAAQLIYANAQGSSQFINMDFQLYQDGSQFNDKIRQIPNFRFIISEYTAIRILVNNGESVNFTFKFQSTGAANVMELVR